MISVDLEFEPDSLDRLLVRFLSLPPSLRPNQFSDDETDKRRRMPIDDHLAFSAFFNKRSTGFFLFGSRSHYFATTAPGKSIKVYGSISDGSNLAGPFLAHLAGALPIFGYACEEAERLKWNRFTVQQGINSIESWVGRDPQKYVPGLYWWTLLPTALAEKHRVSLAAIKKVALEHVEIDDGQNLFRFYDKPSDWRSADHVEALRLSQPGIFDIEKVKPLAAATKTFLELSSVTRGWP